MRTTANTAAWYRKVKRINPQCSPIRKEKIIFLFFFFSLQCLNPAEPTGVMIPQYASTKLTLDVINYTVMCVHRLAVKLGGNVEEE